MVNGEKFKWFKAQVDAADEGTTDEQKGEWLRRNVEGNMSDTRDIVDPYVAEALYEEAIAWNIDMRGGGSVSEWPSWEELPDMARDHWMSMAVTARVATRAALAMQANRDEAAEQEDDDIGEALARWANEGGSLIQYDNEAYRRDFPEVTDEDE